MRAMGLSLCQLQVFSVKARQSKAEAHMKGDSRETYLVSYDGVGSWESRNVIILYATQKHRSLHPFPKLPREIL